MKFRTRFFLIFIITIGLMTVILAAYFINFEEKRVHQSLHDQLLIQSKLIVDNFWIKSQLKDFIRIAEIVKRTSAKTNARVTIVAADGTVLGDSADDYTKMPNHKSRPEIKVALTGKEGFSTRYSQTLKQYLIYVAYPIKINNAIVGVVRIAKSQHELNLLLWRLRLLIIGGIILTAVIAMVFGIFIVSRITKPILDLQRLAKRISRGDLSGRVRFFGQDELADLGLAFNSMTERLSDSFAAIKDEKRKIEVILENLVDGILVIDQNLQIVLVNPAAQKILDLNPNNIKGRPIFEVFMNHHLMELIQETNLSQKEFETELNLYSPQKEQLQVFLAPLKDDTGKSIGLIIVLHDLTQIRHLERIRQDFVANVSHELRTPIASIKAMAETLIGGAWQDKEIFLRYLRAIDQESDRLTNLINDLLALTKLDSKVVVPYESFDMIELINEIKERFLPISDQVSSFDILTPGENLPLVYANRDQIKQVLINLLDNAFKYTPVGGQIKIFIEREGEMLKVSIADTGIGIPGEDLNRIFERFYRVDKARSRELGGTGLGLSIVKHIIETHGGKVEVESSLNQGSKFYFTLPILFEE